ncbi:uncharacterized protein N7446_000513 [Penicillium canescens]|uniref:uncharacterized protein n=1 Tax=Penicillium canescens TaxID=5083 RepID=UPI0026DF2CB9|nr:uncharacterized protein N7446_000513 [Penicillium canescens]KAJ6077577.1 hypothetical protein N7446_000513 [Penicillium canescens]
MDVRLLARSLRARPTPFLQQRTQTLPRTTLATSIRFNSSSSDAPTDTPAPVPAASSTQPTTKTATATRGKKPSDFDDILDRLDLNPKQDSPQRGRRIFTDSLSRALGPSLGRQAFVEPERGQDLATALRKLNNTITQNKLRQSANAQRFHTRKGMVAKQKKMMRWRRLFKVSFQSTVQKIQRMQTQGW